MGLSSGALQVLRDLNAAGRNKLQLGVNCMNKTIHLDEKHPKSSLSWPAFSLLGFPEGCSLKLIKSNKLRKKACGEEVGGKKIDIIIWKYAHVPWFKNRLNWTKSSQWKFYKSTVLSCSKWTSLSPFDAGMNTLLLNLPTPITILELWNPMRIR